MTKCKHFIYNDKNQSEPICDNYDEILTSKFQEMCVKDAFDRGECPLSLLQDEGYSSIDDFRSENDIH